MTKKASVPGLARVRATDITSPPAWALLERELMEMMEEATGPMVARHAERGGALMYADDVDDLYERFYNWGLFYSMGASESIFDLALQGWNATTRFFDESVVSRVHDNFHPQIVNEYYSLSHPGDAEWHHKGEGNMAFYDFGVADPTISENVRRARRFAAWYIGEDPDAPNYDSEHKILRSPAQTGQGPWHRATVEQTHQYLLGGRSLESISWYGIRASLHPIVKELEPDWWKKQERKEEIVGLFEKIVLNSDSSNNLGATALVTNAYLYTGDEKYKKWVLEYVDAWMERTKLNGGIMPDNVGPTGKIGENRDGQWWGGLYGWNHYQGFNIMFHGLVTAVECALLLSGDFGYLDFLRSQIELLLNNSIRKDNGQILVPLRYGTNGWDNHQYVRILEAAHLYHASMSTDDYELLVRIRDGDVERDWNKIEDTGEKNVQTQDGHQNTARFNYYDGKNPSWPEQILQSDYRQALATYEKIRTDTRDPQSITAENAHPDNPVFTKALTQVTMGAPQSVYNGGLLRATTRYFDEDRERPGLPPDVAALVDRLGPEVVGVKLVNLNPHETRKVILQAGAFGEHQFTEVRTLETGQDSPKIVPVDARYIGVDLPPSTSIRIEAGMRRFVNNPSYAFPWHKDRIPVPFQ